jgi:hypothetical protein
VLQKSENHTEAPAPVQALPNEQKKAQLEELRLITTKGGLEEADRLVTVGGLTDQLISIL